MCSCEVVVEGEIFSFYEAIGRFASVQSSSVTGKLFDCYFSIKTILKQMCYILWNQRCQQWC